jgi:hypothetical protein
MVTAKVGEAEAMNVLEGTELRLATVTGERDAAYAHLKYEHECYPGKSTEPDACWHHWDNNRDHEKETP